MEQLHQQEKQLHKGQFHLPQEMLELLHLTERAKQYGTDLPAVGTAQASTGTNSCTKYTNSSSSDGNRYSTRYKNSSSNYKFCSTKAPSPGHPPAAGTAPPATGSLHHYTVGKARVSLLLPGIFPCYFMNII
jgi:hypothetical protein